MLTKAADLTFNFNKIAYISVMIRNDKNPENPINRPQIGVAAIITHNNKFLLGRRTSQPMTGSWQLPGGWIHFGESPEQSVARHINYFHGIEFDPVRYVTLTNNLFDQQTHSISLYYITRCLNPLQLRLQDNSHCSDWYWADWFNLPKTLFLPLQLLKQSGVILEYDTFIS